MERSVNLRRRRISARTKLAFSSGSLEIIGFPQDAAMQGVSPEVIDGLLFMMGPLYYIIVYGGLGFAFMYRIDKTRHEEILQAREARRASS